MNLMDLVPIDLVPKILEIVAGVHFQKIVPSTDPNITMCMAMGVFILMLYYSIMITGVVFLTALSFTPFNHCSLIPFNLFM